MTLRPSPLAFIGLFLLGALNILLLVEIVTELTISPDKNSIGKAEPSLKLSAQPEAQPLIKPIVAYQQILTHPLFFKTREPFAPKPPAPPSQSKPIPVLVKFMDPDFVVGGIIIHGNKKQAYLFKKTNPNGAWINMGENFLGWKLQSVSAEAVKLQNDDHTVTLQLYAEH